MLATIQHPSTKKYVETTTEKVSCVVTVWRAMGLQYTLTLTSVLNVTNPCSSLVHCSCLHPTDRVLPAGHHIQGQSDCRVYGDPCPGVST